MPVLLKILRNDSSDSDVRAAAVSGLGKYGSKGLEGAPDLVRLVTDRKAPEPLRIAAMDALDEIPFEDNEFSTTLRGLLKDRRESPSIRGRAAARFIKLNINVKSIIPDLLEVLTETKGATRNSSSSQMVTLRTGTIRHLKNLKAGKQAVDAIVAILGDRNEDVSARQMALDALSSVGSEELAIKAVTKVLSSLPKLPTIFDDHVSLQMIEYLSLKGPAARDAVAVLQIIANQSESRRLREASKDAIEQIVQQD